MKRILYVEANEDGTVGGSHKIQYDLVTRLSPDFDPLVLHYQENIWSSRLRNSGLRVVAWDEVREYEIAALHRSGRVGKLGSHVAAVKRRIRFLKTHGVDLVHLNNSPFVEYQD